MVCQKFIFKIRSGRLRKEKWNLSLPIEEARRNDEVIALADSQMLRWIDELNGIADADAKAREIKLEIRRIRREPNSVQNKRKIKQLYSDLDNLQFKPDYMCLIIDKKKDYYRACKGFSINGIKYKRLLGTNGGIKSSTIVFVSERLWPELNRRIENGRNPEVPLVTAKLEAYKALTCSASTPVSLPNGILVVPDCETKFNADYIYLTDENDGEPIMEERKNQEVVLDASDGFGLMSPTLAQRWSEELQLDYLVAGINCRMSWTKGMIFTFDFLEFAEEVAGEYIVKDAWGNEVDIRNVELILTTSMLKLWDSYESCNSYLEYSLKNGYTFAVTKTCPKELENERTTNYQFLQCFDFDDDDIEELIAPTMNEIKEVLGGDWRKTVLFLKGSGLTEDNISRQQDDIAKAIMIDHRMVDDPHVRKTVFETIKNRITQAKTGVLNVHGNYSIVSGDPYSLCQSIFGLEVTGLLKAGEIYNKYWVDYGSDKVACFRAPMTCINNVLVMHVEGNDKTNHWYQYMNTCTIMNSWDLSCAALNGADFDGDILMITDNPTLLKRHVRTLPLMCAQKRAEKSIPAEEDFINSNIDSFGNDIGKTTNWITSMFEVRSHFSKDSKEYKELSYRIICGQQQQQNCIDRSKGIMCKPMPRTWHDKHAVNKIEDEDTRNFYRSIVADRKPYFMKYIYPSLSKEYNRYRKKANLNCMRDFGLRMENLEIIPEDDLTDEQKDYLEYYEIRSPIGTGNCVVNKICKRFEEEFDGYIKRYNEESDFDYSILKNDYEYKSSQAKSIEKLNDEYRNRLQNYKIYTQYQRVDIWDSMFELRAIDDWYRGECSKICPSRDELCNLLLDICYKKATTKKFVWSMCAKDIIRNLLVRNDGKISFPTLDDDGELTYCGQRYKVITREIEVDDDDSIEGK